MAISRRNPSLHRVANSFAYRSLEGRRCERAQKKTTASIARRANPSVIRGTNLHGRKLKADIQPVSLRCAQIINDDPIPRIDERNAPAMRYGVRKALIGIAECIEVRKSRVD